MIQSYLDTSISEAEFQLFEDQNHLEKVWKIMTPILSKYVDDYLTLISRQEGCRTPQESLTKKIKALIEDNDGLHDKYHELFDLELFDEEYGEDTESFKNQTLRKECDVIRKTLLSKSEVLKEWKGKFNTCKSQTIYDTFYNMMAFAEDYDSKMDEEAMSELDSISECKLSQMQEDACYQTGVLGFGIVSNILNHMYPRTFPGTYKMGIYSLYFLSGAGSGIEMPSESSEFIMVKDATRSKTGVIEQEHNYYYPYQTFCIYTLRIFRFITQEMEKRFGKKYPSDYRFLLTNDFYNYVTDQNRSAITTMNGNDDVFKFYTSW